MPQTGLATLTQEQRAFLGETFVAVVATVGGDGTPHQATVWHRLEPDDTIMLNGRAARRWLGELRATGRMSIAVLDPRQSYRWLGLSTELVSVDDDPVRGLDGIMALHRRYTNGEAGPDVEAAYAAHPRVTVTVRVTAAHDHLDRD